MEDDIKTYTSDERFKNFLTLLVALKFTKDGLKDYVLISMKDLYQRLSNKCTGYLPCEHNCSKCENHVRNWCVTCKKWRTEILKFMRSKKMKERADHDLRWKKVNSTSWGRKYDSQTLRHLASIFIHSQQDLHSTVLDDLVNLFSVLQNCSYFEIGKDLSLIERARKIRNRYFAHNDQSFFIEENELQSCLNDLTYFLKNPCFRWNRKCIQTVELLNDLKSPEKRVFNDSRSSLISEFYGISKSDANNEQVISRALQFIAQEDNKESSTSQHRKQQSVHLIRNVLVFFIFLQLFLLWLLWCSYSEIPQRQKVKGQTFRDHTKKIKPVDITKCKSMRFNFPWKSDLDFDFYLKSHGPLTGRKWLMEELSYNLLSKENHGILLTAPMGFGKSALVSHIACDNDELSPGFPIYKSMIGIHMCKYDSKSTLNPGIFVRNLAGALAHRIPEYGGIIFNNDMAYSYLFEGKCIEDPVVCFDLGVLGPLKQIQPPNHPIVIIVDALDECLEFGDINIFSLLSGRISQSPAFLKFLLTSRNISYIHSNLSPGIEIYKYTDKDNNNIDDIKKFLRNKIDNHVYTNLSEKLSISNKEQIIDKVIAIADANFLFVFHALDYWLKDNDINHVPSSIEFVYRKNLNRVFRRCVEKFENVRSLFELLCSSSSTLSTKYTFRVLGVSEERELRQILNILSNELSHFISQYNGTIAFFHKWVSEIICDGDMANDFYISKKNGHYRFGKFLIQHFAQHNDTSFNLEIIEIAAHVAKSESEQLRNEFLHMSMKYRSNSVIKHLLHKAAVRINSYAGMKLLIDVIGDKYVDSLDAGKLTPSYIAAAYGHELSLKALLDNGGNVRFSRGGPRIQSSVSDLDIISLCKYNHWGYSLLNIASQNGHEHVVRTLIRNGADINHRTAFGSSSFELASEHGHLRVLRVILRASASYHAVLNNSLYLASKNGHVKVVEFLINHGAEDSCLPCNGTEYWIRSNQTRLQSVNEFRSQQREHYVLKDDRRHVFCETALEIAVQEGHIEIVKVLLEHFPTTLNCRDGRGKTPFLTSVVHSRSEIFKYFLERGISLDVRCSKLRNKKLINGYYERIQYNSDVCPFNTSILHLMAMHGRETDILFHVIRLRLRDMSGIYDLEMSTPLHYASCHGHPVFASLLAETTLSLSDRTINGSTPVHSAAICKRFITLFLFFGNFEISLHEKDYKSRTILHYLAMDNLIKSDAFALEQLNLYYQVTIEKIIKTQKEYSRCMLQQDDFGKMPAHYAALTGNFNILLTEKFELSPDILCTKDSDNKTVIDIVFESISTFQNDDIFVLSSTCNITEIFSPSCEHEAKFALNAHEYFAHIFLSKVARKHKLSLKFNMRMCIELALKKNRYYMISLLLYYFPDEYKNCILENAKRFSDIFLNGNNFSPLISSTFLDIISPAVCNIGLKDMYITRIFVDINRKYWPLFITLVVGDIRYEFKKLYFVNSNCSNSVGLAALDNAIVGGNKLAKSSVTIDGNVLAISFGKIVKSNIHILDLIYIAPYVTKCNRMLYSRYLLLESRKWINLFQDNELYYSHVDMVNNLMDINEYHIPHYVLQCYTRYSELSLWHIAAAKGFHRFIHRVSMLTSVRKIMNVHQCHNKFKITPAHLAFFFNHKYPVLYTVQEISYTNPHFVSLLLKVLMDYKTFIYPRNSAAWSCSWYVHKMNRRTPKRLSCLGNIEREIVTLKSTFLTVDGRFMKNILSIISHTESSQQNQFIDNWKYIYRIYFSKSSLHGNFKDISNKYNNLFNRYTTWIKKESCLRIKQYSFPRYKSRKCLRYLFKTSIMQKHLHHRMETGMQLIFALVYGLYNEKHTLPQLARKDALTNIQVMHAFSALPRFHNSPKFQYWDILKSPFNDPFREMTQTILRSNINKILTWKMGHTDKDTPDRDFLTSSPLKQYESLLNDNV